MTSNQAVIQQADELRPTATHASTSNRVAWRQVALNVAYVLLAGPLGLGYVLFLTIGLGLDLPWLALRLLPAAILNLLDTTARPLRWLWRFSLHLLRAGRIALLVWAIREPWRLLVSATHAGWHIVSSLLRDPAHPRKTWCRTVKRMRSDRDNIRKPRRSDAAPSSTAVVPIRERADRFFDVCADGVQRMSRHVVPERWVFIPVICWHLVMWERCHTMRWLNIELPSLEAPRQTPDDRSARISLLPIASLGYVLAKVPLGLLAIGVIVFAVGSGGVVLEIITHELAVIPVLLVQVLVVISALHLVAQASARLAQRVFNPSPAVRRLQVAEALVAESRVKVERAEQSRRDLIINVGHELRTPTASILGHVESLQLALDSPAGGLDPETLRMYLAIVEREAERLSALVDDLLAVARAERAELQLVLTPVDAAEVIHEVYQALALLARRERQVMLVHEEPPHLPLLLADRQRLSQILLNLVRNAITYTPPGGIVSIGVRHAESDRLLLTVADTGRGIAPADLERVFERFYRADASRARSSGGFGLGLTIARDLVEAMGGTITAESIVGEGSRFHVWLPIATNNG